MKAQSQKEKNYNLSLTQDQVQRKSESVEYSHRSSEVEELQRKANESPRVKGLMELQQKADNSTYLQRKKEKGVGSFVQKKQQPFIDKMEIKPKLKVSDPSDKYEREADAVADKVMRMPNVDKELDVDETNETEELQTKPMNTIATVINREQDEEKLGIEEEDETISAKQENVYRKEKVSAGTESKINNLGAGRSLSTSERSFFEPRFGADFSNVRVHNDSKANEAASEINAKAFTKDSNVVFAKGEYSPGSESSKKLMAHELAHVVQKSHSKSGLMHRKTKGEQTRQNMKNWMDTDSNLKIEVDVLKAALREIAKNKSAKYNYNAGLKRLTSATMILNIKPAQAKILYDLWDYFYKNRKSSRAKTYRQKKLLFFRTLRSPLSNIKRSYPKQHAHYAMKHTSANILDLIYKVADHVVTKEQLWTLAYCEGLDKFVRNRLNIFDKRNFPMEYQLNTLNVDTRVDSFEYLGQDDFSSEYKAGKLNEFLPKDFKKNDYREILPENEKEKIVQSGEFVNLHKALQGLVAMFKKRRKVFLTAVKKYGYNVPTSDEMFFWTYTFFNAGEGEGRRTLKNGITKSKRNLSYWIRKGIYKNSQKALHTYKMIRKMNVFK